MNGVFKVLSFSIPLLWMTSTLLVTLAISSVGTHPVERDGLQTVTWGKERVPRSLPAFYRRTPRRDMRVLSPKAINETLVRNSTEQFAQVQLRFFASQPQMYLRNLARARLNVTISDVTANQISPLILSGLETTFSKRSSGESSSSSSFQYLQQAPPASTSPSGVTLFDLTSIFNSINSQLAPNTTLTLVFTLRVACETARFNEVDRAEEEIETIMSCGPVLNLLSGHSFLRLDYTNKTDEQTLPELQLLLNGPLNLRNAMRRI